VQEHSTLNGRDGSSSIVPDCESSHHGDFLGYRRMPGHNRHQVLHRCSASDRDREHLDDLTGVIDKNVDA
jgi:hypothetical protein